MLPTFGNFILFCYSIITVWGMRSEDMQFHEILLQAQFSVR